MEQCASPCLLGRGFLGYCEALLVHLLASTAPFFW